MSVITIRLSDDLLQELDKNAHSAHVARTEYIRLAIINMNKKILHQKREQQLMKASLRVRKESMRINAEFSKVENDPEA